MSDVSTATQPEKKKSPLEVIEETGRAVLNGTDPEALRKGFELVDAAANANLPIYTNVPAPAGAKSHVDALVSLLDADAGSLVPQDGMVYLIAPIKERKYVDDKDQPLADRTDGKAPTFTVKVNQNGIMVDSTVTATRRKEFTTAFTVSLMPSFDAVINHPKGGDYVRDTVYSTMAAKLTGSIKALILAKSSQPLPFGTDSFIVSLARVAEDLTAFGRTSPHVIKWFHSRRITIMTKAILVKCYKSQSYATINFPKIPHDLWDKLLAGQIETARRGNIAGIETLESWAATRHEVAEQDDDNIDVSDIDSLFSGSGE